MTGHTNVIDYNKRHSQQHAQSSPSSFHSRPHTDHIKAYFYCRSYNLHYLHLTGHTFIALFMSSPSYIRIDLDSSSSDSSEEYLDNEQEDSNEGPSDIPLPVILPSQPSINNTDNNSPPIAIVHTDNDGNTINPYTKLLAIRYPDNTLAVAAPPEHENLLIGKPYEYVELSSYNISSIICHNSQRSNHNITLYIGLI